MHLTDPEIDPIVERTIAWAIARTGDARSALRCLAFVEDAYERANGIEVFAVDRSAIRMPG
jgi:hypothetical protein